MRHLCSLCFDSLEKYICFPESNTNSYFVSQKSIRFFKMVGSSGRVKKFEKLASKNKHPIKLRFLIWRLQSANPEKKVIPENQGFGSCPFHFFIFFQIPDILEWAGPLFSKFGQEWAGPGPAHSETS